MEEQVRRFCGFRLTQQGSSAVVSPPSPDCGGRNPVRAGSLSGFAPPFYSGFEFRSPTQTFAGKLAPLSYQWQHDYEGPLVFGDSVEKADDVVVLLLVIVPVRQSLQGQSR